MFRAFFDLPFAGLRALFGAGAACFHLEQVELRERELDRPLPADEVEAERAEKIVLARPQEREHRALLREVLDAFEDKLARIALAAKLGARSDAADPPGRHFNALDIYI